MNLCQDTTLAAAMSLPCPNCNASKLLPKLSPADDMEVYLMAFEQVARWEAWPECTWSDTLFPLLTGEAQQVYQRRKRPTSPLSRMRRLSVAGIQRTRRQGNSTSGVISKKGSPRPKWMTFCFFTSPLGLADFLKAIRKGIVSQGRKKMPAPTPSHSLALQESLSLFWWQWHEER